MLLFLSTLIYLFNNILFRSLPSKVVMTIWWIFVIFIISCYNANLTAFLTINKLDSNINSPEELLLHPEIKIVAVGGGSTIDTLKVAKVELFKQLAKEIEADVEHYPPLNLQKMLDIVMGGGKVAAVDESRVYNLVDLCKLHQIGPSLIDTYYGIALPKSQ